MTSFGYNTAAMAQRYMSVDDEASAKKGALLCFGLFLVGSVLWFLPPLAMRVLHPDLQGVWPGLANPHESSYALAALTLASERPRRDHAGGDLQRDDVEHLRPSQHPRQHHLEGHLSGAVPATRC